MQLICRLRRHHQRSVHVRRAVSTITGRLNTQYAASTAQALSNQLAAVAEQLDAINAERDGLANEIVALEQRLSALEAAA